MSQITEILAEITTTIGGLNGNKADIRNALVSKGITSASGHDMDDFATDIAAINTTSPTIGGASCAQGSFTVASDFTTVNSVYNISHSLGRTPSAFVLWCTNKTSANDWILIQLFWNEYSGVVECYRNNSLGTGGYLGGGPTGNATPLTYDSVAVTSSNIAITILHASSGFKAGDSYYWIAW